MDQSCKKSYPVYKVWSIDAPRNHLAIFIQTSLEGEGQILQVTGNIQSGMTYETKSSVKREDDVSFIQKELIGTVRGANLHLVDSTCCAIPVPRKQFDGPRRLYPETPLRRYQEWAIEAIEALIIIDIND